VYRYVERGEIRPLVALSFPLNRIVEAQKALLERRHVGKIVLVPEHPNDVVEEGPE
jgi:NADPH:quinone reductase-like Zn-dependent oxidoreductase